MALEALKKFADELKLYRESKAITLQQIAGKTKIDLKFLQAIEDANFEILPEIYIRAFIKEYSQTIDLNPKEILQKFDNARSGRQEEKPAEVAPQETIKPETERVEGLKLDTKVETIPQISIPKAFNSDDANPAGEVAAEIKKKNWLKTNYIIGSAITIAAILLIYFSFFNGSSSEIIQVTPDQETSNAGSERFELEKQKAPQNVSGETVEEAVAVYSPDSLYLSVTATEKVWIKVSADGKIVQQGIVDADTKLNFVSKKNFGFSVGNAGRVKLSFNGKPVENVGKSGEIRYLLLTSDDIKYYTIPPQKNEKKSSKQN